MKIRFTNEDINRSRLLEPNLWYECEVTKVYDTSARDGSINTNVDLRVTSGPHAGAVVYSVFNEKAPGFAIPFLEALGIRPTPGVDYDLSAAEGRKLKVFVTHREYEGKYYNRPVDYRPID